LAVARLDRALFKVLSNEANHVFIDTTLPWDEGGAKVAHHTGVFCQLLAQRLLSALVIGQRLTQGVRNADLFLCERWQHIGRVGGLGDWQLDQHQ
jgi:hypothetical protein